MWGLSCIVTFQDSGDRRQNRRVRAGRDYISPNIHPREVEAYHHHHHAQSAHSRMSPEKPPAIAGNDEECAVVTADETRASVPPPPYSAFTPSQKRWIVFLAALAGMFSPMSSFIFYPAINSIAHSLDVTVGLVNLAITTYMVVSGVTPALLGNAADKIGRRPVYLLALGLYFVANIGLALQSDFAALLVLRMVQSAGSSGTCSVFSGFMVRCLVDRAHGAQ